MFLAYCGIRMALFTLPLLLYFSLAPYLLTNNMDPIFSDLVLYMHQVLYTLS
jgi:hypothetical protein